MRPNVEPTSRNEIYLLAVQSINNMAYLPQVFLRNILCKILLTGATGNSGISTSKLHFKVIRNCASYIAEFHAGNSFECRNPSCLKKGQALGLGMSK